MKVSIPIAAVLLAPLAADAHHSFGTFDMNRDVVITGTVTELAFVNPHSWLYLDVVDENGEAIAYKCELRSATTLRRSGWTEDMFRPGSQITIEGSPDRNDPHACYLSTVIFADGSRIDRYGQRTAPIPVTTTRSPRLPTGEPNIAGEWAAEQLVMTDPRGQAGTLVPLSEAAELEPGELPEGVGAIPGARGASGGGAPFVSAEVARRMFQARIDLTDAGRQAVAARGADPARSCEPISVVVDWSYDSPVNRITQTGDTIVLEYGKFDYVRTIHMSMTEHPADLEPSRTGHSIGRWEGDVLVVDTVGFAPGALTRGLVHSDRLHLVERFSLEEETWALTRSLVAEDPLYFAEPFTGADVVYPSNVPYATAPCDDRSLFPE